MNINLRRYSVKPDTTDGEIFINGTKVCDSAEYTPTALKCGTYRVTIQTCKHCHRKVPVVMVEEVTCHPSQVPQAQPCKNCPRQKNVTCNTNLPTYCPQLKMGNGVHKRTDGRIIVGHRITRGVLGHSKPIYDVLYERIRKATQRGYDVYLHIYKA